MSRHVVWWLILKKCGDSTDVIRNSLLTNLFVSKTNWCPGVIDFPILQVFATFVTGNTLITLSQCLSCAFHFRMHCRFPTFWRSRFPCCVSIFPSAWFVHFWDDDRQLEPTKDIYDSGHNRELKWICRIWPGLWLYYASGILYFIASRQHRAQQDKLLIIILPQHSASVQRNNNKRER